MDRLNLAFLWHMHQPYYKNLSTGDYLLPWVLLHGTKDYFDMAAILKEFPGLRQNFNLVPSLLLQMEDYISGDARDAYLAVFRKGPEELTGKDKVFLLTNFFNANWENMIRPFPRYYELLKKRGFYYPRDGAEGISDYFNNDELRDVQVLFFLAWIDPSFYETYEELKYLRLKERLYSEEDKEMVEEVQRHILKGTIPLYRELSAAGTIEISTSPFYHPIIPLLIDGNVAREAMPAVNLPSKPFRHPEDASHQIGRAVELFRGLFGAAPRGMWPPEGSVSDAALELYIDHNVGWVATDENILFQSLRVDGRRDWNGFTASPELLYKSYRYERKGESIRILFRDQNLSDLISFHYAKSAPKDAANDLLRRLKTIRESVVGKVKHPIVTIAMDGENAWESYTNDGWDFLRFLYEGILKESAIKSTTISDYLESEPEYGTLYHTFAGSWIGHNFGIWIGHPEDNIGWTLLGETRDFLEKEDPAKANANAWESLYIAEGSDWFWWYGDEHSSDDDDVFDMLFRENLANVYRATGKEPPQALSIPIILEDREVMAEREPANFVDPVLDGKVTNYFEWIGAGYVAGRGHGAAMHESVAMIKALFFGFNQKNLFLRIDMDRTLVHNMEDVSLEINVLGKQPLKILCYGVPEKNKVLSKREDGSYATCDLTLEMANEEIFEVGIPFSLLNSLSGDTLQVWVILRSKGMEFDRIPRKGYLPVAVPRETFEMEMWYI